MSKKTTTKKSATKSSGGGSAKKPAKTAKPAKAAKSKVDAADVSEEASEAAPAKKSSGRSAGAIAEGILAAENINQRVAEQGELMMDERGTTATQAARVVSELLTHKVQFVVPLVDKFAKGITSPHKRVVQTSAEALPAVARVAPARVARHLELLKDSFEPANDVGRDGLVRTFAALCTASVAYQKRLEPVLTRALDSAEGKVLLKWTEIVLPALKGEPHARARAVVEARLYRIPRATAQQIADFLGMKLRARYR